MQLPAYNLSACVVFVQVLLQRWVNCNGRPFSVTTNGSAGTSIMPQEILYKLQICIVFVHAHQCFSVHSCTQVFTTLSPNDESSVTRSFLLPVYTDMFTQL